ncbi:hypothetical protein O1M63_46925 [Streptomyces mirabilis]|nr:hypothetical protein [Streptomyces mirabilis]
MARLRPFRPADALDADAQTALEKVLRAWRTPTRSCRPTPGGRDPARTAALPLAAAAAAMDAAVHAWDIAVATGQDAPLEEELAEGIRLAADRLADHLRDAYGCSPPPARCRRPPAGRRRCSPSSAGTRTGRPPCPDPRTD